uniref:RRM domain-containing protein n=1 Tax=Parascaris equorum TaxID=6256 RepID=A0A914RXY1_PAREQ
MQHTGGGGGATSGSGGGAYNARYHFQAAQSAGFDTGSDDRQPRTVYVGNLDTSITEDFVATLFGQIGPVTKTKVIFDVRLTAARVAERQTNTQTLWRYCGRTLCLSLCQWEAEPHLRAFR